MLDMKDNPLRGARMVAINNHIVGSQVGSARSFSY